MTSYNLRYIFSKNYFSNTKFRQILIHFEFSNKVSPNNLKRILSNLEGNTFEVENFHILLKGYSINKE